jgi:adenylate cyclase
MSSDTSSDLAGKLLGERKLVAVLYADMVGYSRLIGLDDAGTLARLKRLRSDLIDPAISEHRGRIVQTGGDSLLVTFDSIDGAVRCAVKVQQHVPNFDDDQPPDRAILFRIGINIGDAIADGTDLHGDAVNVVARLQAECPPGSICVSRSVRDHVHGRLSLEFEELGTLNLKNIARPVEAFVVWVGQRSNELKPARRLEALPLPDRPSIAVLPFQNMSGDQDQEYFADGIVEDITSALSRTGWLFVIARNSAFTYKGRVVDVRQVGRELGIRYVLEGSIRRAGVRVRITCQLIEASTGRHVWADRFESEAADIFDLQDSITESVAGAIEPKLQRAEIARSVAKPTDSLDAYDFYLRSLPHFYANTRADLDVAIALLSRAWDADPHYARAKAFLAHTYAMRDVQLWATPDERALALRLAREVLAAGTDDPEALRCVGHVLSYVGHDYSAALTVLNRALRLNPHSAGILNTLAAAHCQANDPKPAIDYFHRAIRLSPLDPKIGLILTGLGQAHMLMGNTTLALPFLQRAVQEWPTYAHGHRMLILSLFRLRRFDEARKAANRLLEIFPDQPRRS